MIRALVLAVLLSNGGSAACEPPADGARIEAPHTERSPWETSSTASASMLVAPAGRTFELLLPPVAPLVIDFASHDGLGPSEGHASSIERPPTR
ncbi:MAG: hypothetical protein K8H88_26765 [Sandaracinaceae bacterium]|nr:hypothetical protein [Sandaracinaceae bacterium]